MTLRIDRQNGVPLYVQLRDQMAELIDSGLWRRGFKLPPERHLAEVLGVSRNTVSLAYKGLADRGLVVSQQGRGTFVQRSGLGGTGADSEDPERHLNVLIDRLLDEVTEQGFDLVAVERIFRRRVEARRSLLAGIDVAFVECNSEQLDFFTRSLELGAGVRVLPILIDDLLSEDSDLAQRLREMDLVVTTFFHLDEVQEVLGGDVEVLGIALDPEMETMVRLAQVPADRPVALVCLSRVFAERVRKSLEQSGLAHLDTRIELSRDPEVLGKALMGVGAAIVSPGRRKDVERLCSGDLPIIEFIYKPDAGSVNVLQRKLIERHRNRGGDSVGVE